MTVFIEAFIEKCPECGAEYELLAIAQDLHVVHHIPFYVLKGKPVSSAHMHQIIAFASSGKKPIYVCYNREFYEFLIDQYGDKINVVMAEDFNSDERDMSWLRL
ncbi:MAG: hypothetical protein ACTSWN_17380 [Promethearchaeota archaeon]